jgi:predicted nucleic acid-binding protein
MIALDSNILIYFFDPQSEFFEKASLVIQHAKDNNIHLAISTLAITEILSGTDELRIINAFLTNHVHLVDTTREVATLAGTLRYRHSSLPTADSIHLASAITSKASPFITNDKPFAKIAKQHIQTELL